MIYWEWWKVPPCWIEVACPRITNMVEGDALSFAEKKSIYQEIKQFEKELVGQFGVVGWVTWTHLENSHIMRFLDKLGAFPFMIRDNKMYFKRIVNQ